jgi:hypothetical protein
MRPELRIITFASLLIPAGIAHAQFSALELVNETDERLILDPTFEYLNLEKDITWGDFDNDGDVDVAVAMKFVGSIEGGWPNLLLMNENGVLTDRTDQFATDSDLGGDDGFAAPSNDRNVEAMDVNNDGFLDLVTATTMSDGMDWTLGQPRVHLNLGNDQNGNWLGFRHEHLRIPEMFAVNGSVANPRFCDIAWADFNGDGYVDLFYTDYDTPETSGTYCIDINGDGDTTDPGECQASPPENASDDFDAKLLFNWGDDPAGPGPGYFYDTLNTSMTNSELSTDFGNAAEAADFNNDGKIDIMACNTLGANIVEIFYNEGSTPGTDFNSDVVYVGAPYHFKVDDLDGDADLDFIIIDDSQDRYAINTGNGSDGRANFTTYVIGDSLSEFGNTPSCFDLDNDGDLDCFVADVDADLPSFCPSTGRRSHLYENTGVISQLFVENTLPIPSSELSASFDIAPVDFNGDGYIDIFQARCSGFTVWMNKPPLRVDFEYPDGLPTTIEPGVETELSIRLTEVGGSVAPGTALLNYSIDGAAFETSQLEQITGTSWRTSLPALDCGSQIQYYMSAELSGLAFADPTNAPENAYQTSPATGEEITVESFESGSDGFTTQATASTTAGFWQLADPNGSFSSGQQMAPDDDASEDGVLCYVTQNGLVGASAGSNDLDSGSVTLLSPVIDLSGSDAQISVMVWFSCDDASGTPADADSMLIEVTNNGTDWSLAYEVDADTNGNGMLEGIDNNWYPRTFVISELVEPTSTVQIRFVATDNPNNSITEAGVDDFIITRLICEQGPACPADLNNDGSVSGSDLAVTLSAWGSDDSSADLNSDGLVNGQDLAIILSAWGPCSN